MLFGLDLAGFLLHGHHDLKSLFTIAFLAYALGRLAPRLAIESGPVSLEDRDGEIGVEYVERLSWLLTLDEGECLKGSALEGDSVLSGLGRCIASELQDTHARVVQGDPRFVVASRFGEYEFLAYFAVSAYEAILHFTDVLEFRSP